MRPQEWADETLRKWRDPIEERSWFAVNDLDSATDRLIEICGHREGIKYLRDEQQRIAPNVKRLCDLLTNLSSTEYKEAAE